MSVSSRVRLIVHYLKKVEDSKLSAQEFFEKHKVPFSLAQYYRYKLLYKNHGVQGLLDGRAQGNHRCLTADAQHFLMGFHAANTNAKLADYQSALITHSGIRVDYATISRFFSANQIILAKSKSDRKSVV